MPKQMGNSSSGTDQLDDAEKNLGRTTQAADSRSAAEAQGSLPEQRSMGEGPDTAMAGILDRRDDDDDLYASPDSDESPETEEVDFFGSYGDEGGLLAAGEEVGPWSEDEAGYNAAEDSHDEVMGAQPGGGSPSKSERPDSPDRRWGRGRR